MKKYLVAGIGSLALMGAALSPLFKQELLQDFSGGLNTSAPSHKIANNYSPYMRNVFVDDGGINKINGYTVLGSSRTLQKVTGIFPFVRENGQVTFLVTDSSVTLETNNFTSWVFVSSGSNTGSLLNWMQVRNKMWGFNGIDPVITWDGASQAKLDGSKSTPNVPRFKYGAYYQDRVWGFGIPSAASDLYFSAVITTDNIIVSPDNQFAWPLNYLIHVGQGDGQIGTALWTYQGLLRAGKEQSIYTIYGDNPTSYVPRKEEANIGIVSNDSVRVMDGETHFLSQDGIYSNVKRISDDIEPDIDAINKGITGIVQNSWDTQSEFGNGQFFGTTATPAGLMQSQKVSYRINTAESVPVGVFNQLVTTGPTSADFAALSAALSPPGDAYLTPFSMRFWGRTNGNCGNVRVSMRNFRNPASPDTGFTVNSSLFGAGFNGLVLTPWPTTPEYSGTDVAASSVAIKFELLTPPANCVFDYYPATNTNFSTIDLIASSRTQYMSEVATVPMITAWGIFDSVNNPNGPTPPVISFFFRTSTSVINITTQTWQPIVPGSVISAPLINSYFQWASSFTAFSADTPNIDLVTVSHIEGQDTIARTFAMDWGNRYWLNTSTTSDPTKRLIYVKSKVTNTNPSAWMPIQDIPVCGWGKRGDFFYGGLCSTGVVVRLDYGNSFNGSTITATYDTPDMLLGNYFLNKNIIKFAVDGDKSSGGSLNVGRSIDGADFVYSTFSITGSGRYSHVIEGVRKSGGTLRVRLMNGEVGQPMRVNGLGIIYEETGILSNK